MSRRQKLATRYLSLSLVVLGATAGVALVSSRRDSSPVVPGDRDIEGLTAKLEREAPEAVPEIRFRDVTAESGVNFLHFGAERSRVLPEDMGSGVALVDYDRDGDLDIFSVNFEPLEPSKKREGARRGHALFRNDGEWRFTDVSAAAGIATAVHGMAVAAGDFDRDGLPDLYVTCYGENQLFQNLGDGTFAEVAAEAGVSDPRFSAGAMFADYDLDGDLDLYVTSYVAFRDDPLLRGRTALQGRYQIPVSINPSTYPAVVNTLYRNLGDGTFEDVTWAAGVAGEHGKSLGAAFTDLSGDGLPDIYVANDVSDNAYYLNVGGGRFTDVSYPTRTADYRGAMGLAVRDHDADGETDFLVTHWLAQENGFYERLSTSDEGYPVYADVADYQGLGQVALDYVGWGTAFFECDNDGRPDLVVVNGSTLEEKGRPAELIPQRPLLFWNGGTEYFDVGERSGKFFRSARNARGLAAGDIDRDGDEDLCVLVLGGRLRLLRNDTPTENHWVRVVCRKKSGAAAIGARVTIAAGGRKQVQTIGEQPSYLSSLPHEAHFGLGSASRIERLTVRFPGGSEEVIEEIEADREVVVVEP